MSEVWVPCKGAFSNLSWSRCVASSFDEDLFHCDSSRNLWVWTNLMFVLGIGFWFFCLENPNGWDYEYHRSKAMKSMKKVYEAEEAGVWQSMFLWQRLVLKAIWFSNKVYQASIKNPLNLNWMKMRKSKSTFYLNQSVYARPTEESLCRGSRRWTHHWQLERNLKYRQWILSPTL